jgi:tetratricopeptide (TPR) repeat protein
MRHHKFILSGLIFCFAGCHAVSPVDEVNHVGLSTVPVTEVQKVSIKAGELAMAASDYDEALKIFKEVISQNPVATNAFVGIGDIYLIKKDWKKAEPVFARAVKLDPRNFDAQYGYGVSLQMLKKFVDAVRAYHRALTLHPEDMGANMNIATTYLQMDKPQNALVFAERAIQLEGNQAHAQITLAATYQMLDRTTDALNSYIAASEAMNEPSPRLMRSIILLLIKEKRYQEIVNTASQLIKLEPTSEVYEQLGWAEFRLGDYESSLEAYKTSVAYDQNNWRALNGIGVNKLNDWLLGDKINPETYQIASKAFRQSLEINPDQPKVIDLVLFYGL